GGANRDFECSGVDFREKFSSQTRTESHHSSRESRQREPNHESSNAKNAIQHPYIRRNANFNQRLPFRKHSCNQPFWLFGMMFVTVIVVMFMTPQPRGTANRNECP